MSRLIKSFLSRLGNALAFDNVGNLDELRRRLADDGARRGSGIAPGQGTRISATSESSPGSGR